MLKIELNEGKISLNLPTSMSEIETPYLRYVSDEISVAENYSLIGLIYREKLNNVLAATKNKKPLTTNVVPIFVKSGECQSDFIKSLGCGNKIIIAPSDIELGHHVNCTNNSITIGRVISYCNTDEKFIKKAIQYGEPVLFLEFKLVPNCAIHGCFDETKEPIRYNPFVTNNETQSN